MTARKQTGQKGKRTKVKRPVSARKAVRPKSQKNRQAKKVKPSVPRSTIRSKSIRPKKPAPVRPVVPVDQDRYDVDDRRARREAARVIPVRACPDLKKRERLERNPELWLRHYFPQAYRLPFGQTHKEIIAATMYAMDSGGNVAAAAPRGEGKTTLQLGMCLYCVFTGRAHFPVFLPWSAKDRKIGFGFWINALSFNEKLIEMYPEFCDPFAHAKGKPHRALFAIWPDGRPTGAQIKMFDGMIIFPNNLGAIGSSTINGNPRGLNHPTPDGQVLRPDLALITDPQDEKTAKSRERVQNVIDMIDKGVAGMAGPDRGMPMVMACTIIQPDDVADHYLGPGAPDWKAIKTSQIVTWPSNMKLWEEWNEVRTVGEEQQDRGKAAIKFYRKHRKKLLEGMAVSWIHRCDKERGHPDAYYTAMYDFYRMGKAAFYSERQNDPIREGTQVYNLTTAHVMSKANGMSTFAVPRDARILVAFADINRSGINWCVAAFSQDMSPHVPAYGTWPGNHKDLWEENAPELVRKQAIFNGLTETCRAITQMPFERSGARVRVGLFLPDRGYEPETVHRFSSNAETKCRVIPCRGYAASKYSVRKHTLIGAPAEGCHMTETQFGPFISHNADYWREIAQRSWLGEKGEPGTATLYGEDGRRHARFAEQQCAERLVQKYKTDQGMRWEWSIKPGNPNDLGDAFVGCWVAAAFMGLTSMGMPAQAQRRTRRRETRKPKVEMPS